MMIALWLSWTHPSANAICTLYIWFDVICAGFLLNEELAQKNERRLNKISFNEIFVVRFYFVDVEHMQCRVFFDKNSPCPSGYTSRAFHLIRLRVICSICAVYTNIHINISLKHAKRISHSVSNAHTNCMPQTARQWMKVVQVIVWFCARFCQYDPLWLCFSFKTHRKSNIFMRKNIPF